MERQPAHVSQCDKDIDGALEATGLGKFHAWIVLVGGLMLYAVNVECWSIGYVISHAECELQLDLNAKTLLMSAGAVGMVCTQFVWGYLADKIGRRAVLMHTMALGFLSTVVSAMAPWFWMLVAFRFVNGMFIAGASGLCFAYVGEFFAARHRPAAILSMSVCIGVALVSSPLWAWAILSQNVSLDILALDVPPWRVYLLACGLPAVFAWLCLCCSPESPKYLVQANRCDDALRILTHVHNLNHTGAVHRITGTQNQEYPVGKILHEGEAAKRACVWKLFGRKYMRQTLTVCALQGGAFATSCGLFIWYPDILQQISALRQDATVCEALSAQRSQGSSEDLPAANAARCVFEVDQAVYLQNVFVGLAYTVGYVVISALVGKVGIRNILVSFLGLSSLATFALHFAAQRQVINVLFIVLLTLSGICVVVVNAAVVELFPTHIRGMAVCMAMLSGRLGSILASSLVGYLLLWNCDATFILFGVSLLSSALLSITLGLNGSV